MRLTDLALYSTLSVKTLTRAIADAVHPLPAHRVGRLVLVRKRDFDTWVSETRAALRPVEALGGSAEAKRIALELRGYPVSDARRRR